MCRCLAYKAAALYCHIKYKQKSIVHIYYDRKCDKRFANISGMRLANQSSFCWYSTLPGT